MIDSYLFNVEDVTEEFYKACSLNDYSLVVNLLTNSKTKKLIDIHAYNDIGFIRACQNNNIKLINFFLDSPLLEDNIKIEDAGPSGLIYAYIYDNLEVVEHLIFNRKIAEESINWEVSFQGKDYLLSLFRMREMNQELSGRETEQGKDSKTKI